MNGPRTTIGFVLMTAGLLAAGCNESLPARDDQSTMITTSLSMAAHRESSGENYLRFYFTLRNMTDETIEERFIFTGTVQVEWLPPTDRDSPGVETKRTMTIGRENVFRAPAGFSAGTGILRLPPRDSIVFYVNWNMRSNDSTFLPSFWGALSDNQCSVLYGNGFSSPRRISQRQRFLVSASVKLFDQLAVMYASPVMLSACALAPYVRETNPPQSPCTNINIVDPCVIIGE